MIRRNGKLAKVLAVAALTTTIAGCAQVRGADGYIADNLLISAVKPGVDNRQSVESTLGRPSFTGQFSSNDWYYVSRETRQYAFNMPRPKSQMVLHVQFDPRGNVVAVNQTGIELVQRINPEGDKTPTLGRDRTFFEELFGNIGAVGAAGAGGPGGGGDRP